MGWTLKCVGRRGILGSSRWHWCSLGLPLSPAGLVARVMEVDVRVDARVRLATGVGISTAGL